MVSHFSDLNVRGGASRGGVDPDKAHLFRNFVLPAWRRVRDLDPSSEERARVLKETRDAVRSLYGGEKPTLEQQLGIATDEPGSIIPIFQEERVGGNHTVVGYRDQNSDFVCKIARTSQRSAARFRIENDTIDALVERYPGGLIPVPVFSGESTKHVCIPRQVHLLEPQGDGDEIYLLVERIPGCITLADAMSELVYSRRNTDDLQEREALEHLRRQLANDLVGSFVAVHRALRETTGLVCKKDTSEDDFYTKGLSKLFTVARKLGVSVSGQQKDVIKDFYQRRVNSVLLAVYDSFKARYTGAHPENWLVVLHHENPDALAHALQLQERSIRIAAQDLARYTMGRIDLQYNSERPEVVDLSYAIETLAVSSEEKDRLRLRWMCHLVNEHEPDFYQKYSELLETAPQKGKRKLSAKLKQYTGYSKREIDTLYRVAALDRGYLAGFAQRAEYLIGLDKIITAHAADTGVSLTFFRNGASDPVTGNRVAARLGTERDKLVKTLDMYRNRLDFLLNHPMKREPGYQLMRGIRDAIYERLKDFTPKN